MIKATELVPSIGSAVYFAAYFNFDIGYTRVTFSYNFNTRTYQRCFIAYEICINFTDRQLVVYEYNNTEIALVILATSKLTKAKRVIFGLNHAQERVFSFLSYDEWGL